MIAHTTRIGTLLVHTDLTDGTKLAYVGNGYTELAFRARVVAGDRYRHGHIADD